MSCRFAKCERSTLTNPSRSIGFSSVRKRFTNSVSRDCHKGSLCSSQKSESTSSPVGWDSGCRTTLSNSSFCSCMYPILDVHEGNAGPLIYCVCLSLKGREVPRLSIAWWRTSSFLIDGPPDRGPLGAGRWPHHQSGNSEMKMPSAWTPARRRILWMLWHDLCINRGQRGQCLELLLICSARRKLQEVVERQHVRPLVRRYRWGIRRPTENQR